MSEAGILIRKFKSLPNDLVNLILEYIDTIVYRTGKYIDRISKTDIRYLLLAKLPKPIKITNAQYYIGLRYKEHKVIKITLTYIIQQQNIRISICENIIGNNNLIYRHNYINDILI